jgi:heptosyltransferase II
MSSAPPPPADLDAVPLRVHGPEAGARPAIEPPDPDPGWRACLAHDPAIRRILVMKWSALGDVALATAAIEDLHRAFPAAEIDLDTLPPWRGLFDHDPRFARVISVDLRGRGGRLKGSLEWVRAATAEPYDLVVDLQSSDHSRILLGLLVATRRAPRHRLGGHRGMPYTLAPAPLTGGPYHALARLQRTLSAGGIPAVTDRPVLHPGPEHRERAAALTRRHDLEPGAYALLFPGSQAAGFLKRWGIARFAGLARRLLEEGRAQRVVVAGGPDEVEECRSITEAVGKGAVDLCGKTRILELVPLAEGARLIVANDTGTAHVAAAAGRPMVVVCGPTDPRRVKPAGERVRALQAELACRSCYRKTCWHQSCMVRVGPEDVLRVLDDPALAG